jgi:intein/homing endonuclease
VRTKFPDVELIQPNDSIEFYIDELQNREKYEALTNSNTAIQNKLFNKDIEGAFEELKKLNSFFGKISVDESTTVASGFGDRVKNYLNAKKCEGKIGWQTGFEAIDKHVGGIADEYMVIMGTAGIGKCVDESSMVQCPNGDHITIKQFVEENRKEIMSYDEKNRKFIVSKVKGYIDSGMKEGFLVHTKSGREVVVTKEHPFLLENGKWLSFENGLKVGDRITVPRYHRVKTKNSMKTEEIELIALMLADGCMRSGQVTFSTLDEFLLEKAKNIAKFFDVEVHHIEGCDYRFSKHNPRDHSTVNNIMIFLKALEMWNKLSNQKSIPECILRCSNRQLVSFIEMMFNTDGYASNQSGLIEYYSTSKVMCYQMQTLLMRFGIYSSIRYKKNDFLGCYTLNITSHDLAIFDSLFTLMPRRQERIDKFLLKERNSNVLTVRLSDVDYALMESKIRKYGISNFARLFHKTGKYNKPSCRTISGLLPSNKKFKRLSLERLKMYCSYLSDVKHIRNMTEECIFDEILSIEPVGKRHMYDLEVIGSHNFVVNDILVHNTFLELMMGKNIWMQMDKPVFLVSNEIAPKKMGGRLDAILSQVNYSKYRKGLLSSAEEKKIAKLKEMYKVLPEFYMTNGAGKNVDDIEFEIMSIDPKPGLILVDGLYLTDMGFNDEYKNTSTASRAYQRLKSKLGIPLIATTQMTDDFKTKYARAIQEDADAVLYLKQPPNFRDMKRMELIFTKIREEDSFLKLQMNWDFDKWNFSQIKDDDEGDSDSEVEIN